MPKFTIDLDETTASYLRVLSDGDRVEEVLETLARHASDGVRRPGAWEREWTIQVFGDDWLDKVTFDPSVPFFTVPKK